MILNIIFLPLLFFIGLVTSYEDFRYGLIRNKWIKLGVYGGSLILLLLFVWNFFASQITEFYFFNILDLPPNSPAPVFTVHLSFFKDTIINVFLATLVSFTMWRFKSWAAGDAKLFIVYSLLIPISNYWKSFMPLFPALALLVNIFIIILFYVLFRAFYLCILSTYHNLFLRSEDINTERGYQKKFKNFLLSNVKNLKNTKGIFLVVFLIIFSFSIFQSTIQPYVMFDIFYLQVAIFATIIIFSDFFNDIFKNKIFMRSVAILFVLIGGSSLINNFSYTFFMFVNTSIAMIVFMFIFSFFQGTINFYADKTSVKNININELTLKTLLTREQLITLKINDLGEISPRGLSSEQLNKIKKVALDNNIETVQVYRFMSFAVWMFAGVILTLLLKGSLLNLINNFIVGMMSQGN